MTKKTDYETDTEIVSIFLKGKATFEITDDWTDPKNLVKKKVKPGWVEVSKKKADYLILAYPLSFTRSEDNPKQKAAYEKQIKELEKKEKELKAREEALLKKEKELFSGKKEDKN